MISISSTWGRAAARSWLPVSMASSHHRQGFSSEALVLISCSLNVIMVMITQMTPGLSGGIRGSHIHTQRLHRRRHSAGTAYQSAGRPEPVLVACHPPHSSEDRANNQINSSQPQKSWKAMRERWISFVVWRSMPYSNPITSAFCYPSWCTALKPAWIQTRTPDKNVVD